MLVTTMNCAKTDELIKMLLGWGLGWNQRTIIRRWRPGIHKGRGNYRGHLPAVVSIGNMRHAVNISTIFFAKWQQQCGLSLSVLQKLITRNSKSSVQGGANNRPWLMRVK